jgi:hypothetical protein
MFSLSVYQAAREEDDDAPGDWPTFFQSVLRPQLIGHPSFQGLAEWVARHPVVSEYILQRNLLCCSGPFSIGMLYGYSLLFVCLFIMIMMFISCLFFFITEETDRAAHSLLNMGLLRHATQGARPSFTVLEWTCPILRDLTLVALRPLLLDTPPPVPMTEAGVCLMLF